MRVWVVVEQIDTGESGARVHPTRKEAEADVKTALAEYRRGGAKVRREGDVWYVDEPEATVEIYASELRVPR